MMDQEGSTEAFKDLFFQYYPTFFTFAHSLVDDKISAQQLTMEALSLLWLKRTDILGDINNKAFLYTTIRNHALNYLKHLQRHPDAGAYTGEKEMESFLPGTVLQEIKDFVANHSASSTP